MSIRLDVLRHGFALPAGPSGDASRPLSPAGQAAIREQAQRLVAEGAVPDLILSSPYTRARQTAELIVSGTGATGYEPTSALTPDTEPDALLATLDWLIQPGQHVLIVTHQPLISYFVKLVTNEDVNIGPGTRVQLDVDLPLNAHRGLCRVIRVVNPSASA